MCCEQKHSKKCFFIFIRVLIIFSVRSDSRSSWTWKSLLNEIWKWKFNWICNFYMILEIVIQVQLSLEKSSVIKNIFDWNNWKVFRCSWLMCGDNAIKIKNNLIECGKINWDTFSYDITARRLIKARDNTCWQKSFLFKVN